jgi:GxxExxY protein
MDRPRVKAPLVPLPDEANRVAKEVVDAAFRVHSALGPGLLESVYEVCLLHELGQRGLAVQRQVAVPILYGTVQLESGFRLDLLVNQQVVVELKAVDALLPVHQAQLLTYLKLSGHRLGLLINFNVSVIKEGIRRLAL